MDYTARNTHVLHVVVAAAAFLVSLYFLFKFIIWRVFGVWVGSINPLLWNVRRLHFETKQFRLRLSCFKVRVNLFDSHRKLINFNIEGISIEISDDLSAESGSESVNVKNDKDLLREYLKPVSIYPKSQAVRFLLRHATSFIPSIDVRVKDVELSLRNSPIKLTIKAMDFSTDYDLYGGAKVLQFTTDARITQIKLFFEDEAPQLSTLLYVRVGGIIDVQEGIISKLSSEFKSFSLYIPTWTILKCFMFIRKSIKVKAAKLKRPELKRSNASLFSEDVCFASLVVNLVQENSLRFDDIVIDKIPLLSAYELEQLSERDYAVTNDDKLVFLKGQFKSVSANYTVLKENNAGYDINFQKGDHPFQTVATLMQTLISLDLSHSPTSEINCKPTKTYELMNIPSITISTVTNTLYQLVKRIETGSKFADALFNFNCSVSNPIIDIATEHLGVLLTRLQHMRYYNILNKNPNSAAAASSEYSRTEYIYFLSSIWPQLNVKFLIERPTFILKSRNVETDTISMIVASVSLVNIGVTTTKKVDFHDELVYYMRSSSSISDLSLSFIKKLTNQKSLTPDSVVFELAGDQQVIKSSELNFKFDSRILPDAKITFSLNYESFSVDLSNLIILNGLCQILSDIDNSMVHLSFDQLKKFTAKLKEIQDAKPKRSVSHLLEQMIFRDLPEWFDHVQISGKRFKITAGSRSVLIPADLVAQLNIPDIIDNVDGALRKVSFFVADWSVDIENNRTKPLSVGSGTEEPTSKASNTETDSELSESEETEFEDFWKITSTWRNVHSKVYTEDDAEEGEINPYAMKASTMNKIPNLVLSLRSTMNTLTNKSALRLEGDCDQISVHYSLINHFLLISSFHLLNNTLFKPVIQKFRTVSDMRKKADLDRAGDMTTKLKEILKVFNIKVHFHQISLINHFAEKFKVKVDALKTTFSLEPGSPFRVHNILFRMLVESATSPGFWTRFMAVNNSKISVDVKKLIFKGEHTIDEIGTVVEVANTGCRVIIPHQFVVHKLFDQISVAFKTLKQLHHSLKYNSNEIVIYPHEMKTPRLPGIRFKTTRFLFKMDDDPFESELNMIYQLGVIEQRKRVEKYYNFTRKVAEKLKEGHVDSYMTKRNLNTDGLLESEAKHRYHSRQSFAAKDRVNTDPGSLDSQARSWRKNDTVNESVSKVDELDKKLFIFRKHISRSWIELVRDYRQKMEERIDENSKFLWNLLKLSSYPAGFNHKLIGYSKNPPLTSLIVEHVDLKIRSPNFPLDKVPDYIHDIGKGVPLDTKYTIMLPTYIDLKVKELRMHIRDYPLPLLYIPAIAPDQDQSLPALRIAGTFIVGEELSEREENIRKIYVPLVPAAKKSVNDKYFALDVPKTIASIKVFTNLEFTANSKIATRLTWGQSYQPAIQQIILNFDDFTKPQLDPSDKIGFWDKVRSILHARIRFQWCEEGELVVALKGGRDPYSLLGLSAGFLLGFKNNVVLDINKDDNPKEFLFVKSNEVGWSVANHLALPLLVWFRESSKSLFVPDSEEIYLGSVAGYYLQEQESHSPDRMELMSRHFEEKTVIRLCGDVAFKVGLSFELDKDGKRSSDFRPHYDVQLSNPLFVQDKANYDAYAGFRSQYAHLSISLSSPDSSSLEKVNPRKSADRNHPSYNVAHLSPRAFFHFFAWWKLFSGNMQLPIRRGVLFGPNKTSKKFSEVLSTLQFQFLISPLFLAHIYREDVEQSNPNARTGCVGLKAKADSFTIDLHQRKEAIVNKYSELDKTKSIQKMKMYLGEVDISDVDLRTVKAIFRQNEGALSDNDEDILEFGSHKNNNDGNVFKTFDNDTTWLDIDDFEEVGFQTLKNMRSLVKISPFLFTPRFTYLRQLDHSVPRGTTPADNELAHDCVLGTNKFKETQRILLQARLDELNAQLAEAHTKKIANNLMKGISNVKNLLDVLAQGDADDTLADGDTETGFNNKFLIHNVQVKWNKDVRDVLFRYTHFLTMRRAVQHYLRHQSYAIVDKIVEDQKKEFETENAKLERYQTIKSEYIEEHQIRRDEFTYDDITCSERLDDFDEDLRRVIDSTFRSTDDYLIKLISPQIQLCIDASSESCVLVTSPEIETKIVSIKRASSLDDDGHEILVDNEDAVLEKRYGSLFKDANMFVVYKNQVIPNAFSLYTEDCYGSTSNWPPWIGIELCYDGQSLNHNMILKKTSLVFRYDQIRELIRKTRLNDRKRVILDIPEVITSCDSDQYFAFYDIVLNLLMYKEPSDTQFHEKLTSLILTTDFTDLDGVRDRIRNLQTTHATLNTIGESLVYKRHILSDDEKETLALVVRSKFEIVSELFLLMRLVSKGTASTSNTVNKDEELEWTIRADNIKVHMLDKERNPFIDLIVKDGVFRRIEGSSNSNTNIVQVSSLDAYNLEKNAVFPEMITAYHNKSEKKKNGNKNGQSHVSSEDDDKNFVIEWAMDSPVGGIKVIRSVNVNLLPLKLSMDQSTGEKLYNYVFPPSDDKTHKNILALNNQIKHEADKEDERLFELKKAKANGNHSLKPARSVSFKRFSQDGFNSSSEASSIRSMDSKNKSLMSLSDSKTEVSSGNSFSASVLAKSGDPKYVTQMIERASTFMSIVALTINSFVLNISFRGEKKYRLVNVSNLTLTLPRLQFRNKVWTIEDLVNHIKKLILKALLNHSGVILANKLTHHRKKKIDIDVIQAETEDI